VAIFSNRRKKISRK